MYRRGISAAHFASSCSVAQLAPVSQLRRSWWSTKFPRIAGASDRDHRVHGAGGELTCASPINLGKTSLLDVAKSSLRSPWRLAQQAGARLDERNAHAHACASPRLREPASDQAVGTAPRPEGGCRDFGPRPSGTLARAMMVLPLEGPLLTRQQQKDLYMFTASVRDPTAFAWSGPMRKNFSIRFAQLGRYPLPRLDTFLGEELLQRASRFALNVRHARHALPAREAAGDQCTPQPSTKQRTTRRSQHRKQRVMPSRPGH
ncbi:hypothetical protein PRIC1_008441 [Phytophthora ramorum]